jgi:hypothetical protein
MKMNIRQVQIVLPTFNGFSSLLANKLFDLVFIAEPHRVGAALKTICVILQKKNNCRLFFSIQIMPRCTTLLILCFMCA